MAKGRDPEAIQYAVLQVEGSMSAIDAELSALDRDVRHLEAELVAAAERREFLITLREQYELLLERAA